VAGAWHGWHGSGMSMAEYARREGFDADAWVQTDAAPAVSKAATVKKQRRRIGGGGFCAAPGSALSA
jgi:hypothetical protein